MDGGNKEAKYQKETSCMRRCPQKNKRKKNCKKRIGTIPRFLPFSGSEPTPAGECGVEEFLFQIKGAKMNPGRPSRKVSNLVSSTGGCPRIHKVHRSRSPFRRNYATSKR